MRILVLALLLAACSPEPDTLTKLRMERDDILAEQIRRAASCQAQAVELAQMPALQAKAARECAEGHRVMLELEQESLRDLGRRIAEVSTR